MNQHNPIQIGTLRSQFHHQADGLGHLIQFPVSELEQQAKRLTKILEEQWAKQEVVHTEWDWEKSILSWSVNSHILDELGDVNRAIAIANILWEQGFMALRNTFLSQWLKFSISAGEKTLPSIPVDSFWLIVEKEFSDSNIEQIKRGLHIMNFIADDIWWEYFQKAMEEIENYEENGGENPPFIYKYATIDFIAKFTDYIDEKWSIEGRKEMFRKLIDEINRNLHETPNKESFEKFAKHLRAQYPSEMVDAYRDFTLATSHEEMYPDTSWEEVFEKSLIKTREIIDEKAETPNESVNLVFVTGNDERIDF